MDEIVERSAKKTRIIRGVVIVIVVIAIVGGIWWISTIMQKAADYDKIKSENDALNTKVSSMSKELEQFDDTKKRLAYEEDQVKQLKESTNALKEQVDGLNAEKEDLNNQLEELLNVQETVPVITRALLDEQITSLSELTTKKYWYRNATQKDEAKEWLWGTTMPFSDIQFVALYDGYIKAGIELKEVKFDVNQQAKTITITMPKSKILDHNIPQETINVLQVKNNLFNSVSFNDYNRFISSEKAAMAETAIGQGILTEADEEAKRIIEAFLKNVPGIDQYKLIFK